VRFGRLCLLEMDPKTHQRFLNYLESYEYFKRPNIQRLTREEFAVLDAELAVLVRKERERVPLDDAERSQLGKLRRRLFRD